MLDKAFSIHRVASNKDLPEQGTVLLFVAESSLKNGRVPAILKSLLDVDKVRANLQLKLNEVDNFFLTKTFHPRPQLELRCVFLKKSPSTFQWHDKLRGEIAALLSSLKETTLNEWTLWVDSSLAANLKEQICLDVPAAFELALWKPETYKSAPPKKDEAEKSWQLNLMSDLDKKRGDDLLAEARALAQANNLVRTLSELPGNVLTPEAYRQRIEKILKGRKIKSQFYDFATLKKMGAGAFCAVAQAKNEKNDAGILKLSYRPSKAKKKSLALVGKGVCFDTGGYNIKTGAYMEGMHRDMTGSAIVLSLMLLLEDLNWDGPVDAYLALTENLISPTAFRPNDLVRTLNGKTIEVIDTDAEGRMALSDTLAMASKDQPALLMDFATLTGACVRAVDRLRCGVFSNSRKLGWLAVEVGDDCGERTWPFPIGEDYEKALESDIADLKQCNTAPYADHIYAATFLNHFVEKQVPWLHVDLSAADSKSHLGLVPTAVTGFGPRFAWNFINSFFEKEKTPWL